MSEPRSALLLNDTSLAGNHGSQVAVDQLIRLAGQSAITVAERHPIDVELEKLATDGLDLVIVNGEGSLHHSKKAAKAIARIPAWTADKGLPAFLVNSIYQGNDAAIGKGVSGYQQIYVRDNQSFQELEGEGIKPEAVVDLSLTWAPGHALAPDRKTIIVTDSTVKTTNAALFALSGSLSNGVFVPFRSRPPVVPDHPGQNTANLSRYRMRKITSRFQTKALSRARYANILPTLDEFTRVLCNTACLIVAGRYHGVCIALDLEIPFVAVPSNSFKVEALLEEIGMENRLISGNIARISEHGLMETYGSYTDNERERIRKFRQEQSEQANRMFQNIRASVETRTS